MKLFVHEIYQSIQGESSYSGQKCIFIRLAGCNIRCKWCDTKEAFVQDKQLSIAAILSQIKKYNCNMVELTGGEPLAQKHAWQLLEDLVENKYLTLLETNGFYSVKNINPQVKVILDIKCPGSGEVDKLNNENLDLKREFLEYKFVIENRIDFEYMLSIVNTHNLAKKGIVLLSPVFDKLHPKKLSQWLIDSGVPARLNLQIHKYIWGAKTRGV